MLTAKDYHRRECPSCGARPGRRRKWTFSTCEACGKEGCGSCVSDLFAISLRYLCEPCRRAEHDAANLVRFPVVPGLRTTPEDGEAWWVEMNDGEVSIAHASRISDHLMIDVYGEHGPLSMSWDNVHIARYLGPVSPKPMAFPAADLGSSGGVVIP